MAARSRPGVSSHSMTALLASGFAGSFHAAMRDAERSRRWAVVPEEPEPTVMRQRDGVGGTHAMSPAVCRPSADAPPTAAIKSGWPRASEGADPWRRAPAAPSRSPARAPARTPSFAHAEGRRARLLPPAPRRRERAPYPSARTGSTRPRRALLVPREQAEGCQSQREAEVEKAPRGSRRSRSRRPHRSAQRSVGSSARSVRDQAAS